MHEFFNLQLFKQDEEVLKVEYYQKSKDFFSDYIEKLENNINKITNLNPLKNNDGNFIACKIEELWFPNNKIFNVFISHSHIDYDNALSISYWLRENFHLECFIDSCFWGYSEKLLKKIDDLYCKNENGYYDYEKRNKSTSHIYLMLNLALIKMIENCKYIIFLNSPNSIKINENNQNQDYVTFSPWINSEIAISNLIFNKEKQKIVTESFEAYQKNLNIEYELNLSNFKEVTIQNLYEILKNRTNF